jgi:hypothetical protein
LKSNPPTSARAPVIGIQGNVGTFDFRQLADTPAVFRICITRITAPGTIFRLDSLSLARPALAKRKPSPSWSRCRRWPVLLDDFARAGLGHDCCL